MPFHKSGAYDGFDSIAEAKEYYKRVRTRKFFILTDGAAADLICSCCGSTIAAGPRGKQAVSGYGGNRCNYSPKTKKVTVLHYICAWESLLGKIYDTAY